MSVYTKTNSYTLKQLEAHSKWLNDQLEQFKSISTDFDTVFFYEGYATALRGGASLLVQYIKSLCSVQVILTLTTR